MFRRIEIISSVLALGIGLAWLALAVHIMRTLLLANLGSSIQPVLAPMGLDKFWLYCGLMAVMYTIVPAGAYMHVRGLPTLGRSLSSVGSCVVTAGTAFFVLAPDQFWNLPVIPAEDSAMVVISILSATAAIVSTVAAFTPDTIGLQQHVVQSRPDEQATVSSRQLSEST